MTEKKTKFKLEFKLRQHTPIIHFQHNQSGVTLRATELKPKLDKFLKEERPDLPFGEHEELDYKVKIKAKKILIEDLTPQSFSTFFANMGSEKDNYKSSFTNQQIIVEFFTFNTTIREAIENNFAEFLMYTNFGTRQSKGFGSFYLDISDKNYTDTILPYYFDPNNSYDKSISLLYKALRSGLNEVRSGGKCILYFKSLMFLYAKENLGIQWDKKSIKEKFLNRGLNEQTLKHNNEDILAYSSSEKKLMKDLLGLSSSEEWKIPYKAKIEKKHLPKKIERFKSPIFFKPIKTDSGYRVYIGYDEIPSEMLNTEFEIENGRNTQPLLLKTPDNFDVGDFLKFAFSVDVINHVDSKFRDSKEFKTLKDIFDQLSKQVQEVQND